MTTEVDTICGMSVPTRKRILLTHAQNRNMAEGSTSSLLMCLSVILTRGDVLSTFNIR